MKKGSTIFLRLAIAFIGLVVLALSIFALPEIWRGGSAEFPAASTSVIIIVIGLYITVIPFYLALWQGLRLLNYIDRNTAFSESSVRALKKIKQYALAISIVYVIFVPLLFPIADADDAPGLILFGAAFACAPIVVAVLTAVIQRLLQQAIDIKSENELTV